MNRRKFFAGGGERPALLARCDKLEGAMILWNEYHAVELEAKRLKLALVRILRVASNADDGEYPEIRELALTAIAKYMHISKPEAANRIMKRAPKALCAALVDEATRMS